MAITLISTLTDANIDSPLLILDGKRAIVGHTSNNTLSVIDIEDPRNPTIVTTTAAITDMEPRDGLRIGDSYWITSGATDTSAAIYERTLNNLQEKETIADPLLSESWKFSGHNDGYAAKYRDYLYIPTQGEGSPLITIVDTAAKSVAGSFVPTASNPKVTRVYGCYLFVGSESADGFAVYDLSVTPLAPTLTASLDDVEPINDMLIHPSNGYVYTIRTLPEEQLQSIDISDPTSPGLVDYYDDATLMDDAQSIARIGERLFSAVDTYDGVIQVEIETSVSAPTYEDDIQDNTNLAGAQAIDTDGKYLYVVGNGVFSVLDPDMVENKTKFYGRTTIVGYNQDPPPDDGTEEGNFVRFWGKEQKKLTDPIKDAVVSLDRGVNTTIQKVGSLIGKNAYSSSFYAYRTETQIIENSEEWVVLECDKEEWDNADDYDADEYKWVPLERGIYKIGATFKIDPDDEGVYARYECALFRNGQFVKIIGRTDVPASHGGKSVTVGGTATFQATGCDDEFYEVQVWHNNPASNEQIYATDALYGSAAATAIWGYRVT